MLVVQSDIELARLTATLLHDGKTIFEGKVVGEYPHLKPDAAIRIALSELQPGRNVLMLTGIDRQTREVAAAARVQLWMP